MNNSIIQYVDINTDTYDAKFLVEGFINNSSVKEIVTVPIKKFREIEIVKDINSNLECLRGIKKVKDNLDDPFIKSLIEDIALNKHIEKRNEREELLLMLELKPNRKKKAKFSTYNSKGELVSCY